MKKLVFGYEITSRWSSEDGEFVVTCSAFPSLSILSKSEAIGLANFRDLLLKVIKDMKINNEELPRKNIAARGLKVSKSKRIYTQKTESKVNADSARSIEEKLSA